MRRKRFFLLLVCALVLVAVAAALTGARILAAADIPEAVFSVPWWTVDSGGGASQGGAFTLRGTAGQPDAGISSGGSFTVKGGFWSGAIKYKTYIPLVRR